MQLSASPATIAPLSAAFIAPEQTATSGAGSTTDFAQVFASVGSGATVPTPPATPDSQGVSSEGALPAARTPGSPAAARTGGGARGLCLPGMPPANALPSSQPTLATAGSEVAIEVGPDGQPADVLGALPGRLSRSGRQLASARGEAQQTGTSRGKLAAARAAAEESAGLMVPVPNAPVAAPAPLVIGGLAATGFAEEQAANEAGETLAGVNSAILGEASVHQVGSGAAPHLRQLRRGATGLNENGGLPSADSTRGMAPGSAKLAAHPADGQIAAESPAEDGAPAASGWNVSPQGGAPFAWEKAEQGTLLPSPGTSAGDKRATEPSSLPTPAPVQPVAPLQTGAASPSEASAPGVRLDAGRGDWIARETGALPIAIEPTGASEEDEQTSSDVRSEADGQDFQLPGAIDLFRRPALRAMVGAPSAGERDVSRVANIAGRTEKNPRVLFSESAAPLKHLESTISKAFTSSGPVVGTHTAKAVGSMPVLPSMLADASLPSHVEFSVSEATAMNAAIDSENTAVASAPALAGRAVEAVLTAADRLAAGDRSSVRLEFAMGESELSVRVAMRDNAVRATFQTDSAELRAALAHEWQLMTSEHGDRSFQFAPPAFQTGQGEASGQGTLAGDFSRHQREGQASRANEHEFTGPSRGQRETEAGSPAAVEPGRTELPGYSLHLHTLA